MLLIVPRDHPNVQHFPLINYVEDDRVKAIANFRNERMEEPLEDYLEAFDEYQGHIEELLETTVDLAQLENTALDVLTDPHLLEAFRYLAAPPISQDDLKVLAEAPSLAKGPLHSRPEDVRRLIQVVRLVLDRRRFSWVVENREPTEAERGAAVMASAALMAASRVQTNRRVTAERVCSTERFKDSRDMPVRGASVMLVTYDRRPCPNRSACRHSARD